MWDPDRTLSTCAPSPHWSAYFEPPRAGPQGHSESLPPPPFWGGLGHRGIVHDLVVRLRRVGSVARWLPIVFALQKTVDSQLCTKRYLGRKQTFTE